MMKPTLPFSCMFQVVADNFVAFDLTRMQIYDVIVIPQKTIKPFSVSTFIDILQTADGYVPPFIYLVDQEEEAKAIENCKGRHVRCTRDGNIPIPELSRAILALVEPEEVRAEPFTVPLAVVTSQVSPRSYNETAQPVRSKLRVPSLTQVPQAPIARPSLTALAVPVSTSSVAQAASVEVSPSPRHARVPVPKRPRNVSDGQQESTRPPPHRNSDLIPLSNHVSSYNGPPTLPQVQQEDFSREDDGQHWQSMQWQAQQQLERRRFIAARAASTSQPRQQQRHPTHPHVPQQHLQQSHPYPQPRHHPSHHPMQQFAYQFPPPYPFMQPPPANHAFAPVQSSAGPRTTSGSQQPQQQQRNSHANIPIIPEASSPVRNAAALPLPSPASWLDGLDLDHQVLDQLHSSEHH